MEIYIRCFATANLSALNSNDNYNLLLEGHIKITAGCLMFRNMAAVCRVVRSNPVVVCHDSQCDAQPRAWATPLLQSLGQISLLTSVAQRLCSSTYDAI